MTPGMELEPKYMCVQIGNSLREIMNGKPKLKWCPGYLIRQNYGWPILESYVNGIEPVQEKDVIYNWQRWKNGVFTLFGDQIIAL